MVIVKVTFYLSLGGPNLNLPQPLDIQTNLDGWGQLSFERIGVCVFDILIIILI